jgi:hypothetical protein
MSAPNIKLASAIYGKNAKLAVTTVATAILTNAAASGKAFKVNLLNIANVDGTNAAAISAFINDGQNDRYLAKTVNVPADNSLSIFDKPLYLMEGETLKLQASANGDLEAIASYEEIS